MAEAVYLGSVYATFDLRTDGFTAGVASANQETGRLRDTVLGVFGGNMLFSAVSGITNAVVGFGKSVISGGAELATLNTALGAVARNAGVSQGQLDSFNSQLEAMHIYGTQAKGAMLNLMNAQIPLDASSIKLAQSAQNIATAYGQDTSTTFNTITDAIVSLNPQLLQQFGITENLNVVYGDYAATIGKTASALTEAEKRQALVNLVNIKGAQFAGVYADAQGNVGKKWEQLKSRMDTIAEGIGGLLQPALLSVIGPLEKIATAAAAWLSSPEGIAQIKSLASTVGGAVVTAFTLLWQAIKPAVDAYVNLWQAIQPLLPTLGLLAALMGGALLLAIQLNYKILAFVVNLVADFIKGVEAGNPILTVLAIVIGSIAAAFLVVSTAIAVWNIVVGIATAVSAAFGVVLAVVTSPIFLIGLAIGILIAIGYLLITHWSMVSAFAMSVWGAIWGAVSGASMAIWNTIVTVFTTIYTFIVSILTAVWTFISTVFTTIWTVITTVMNTIWMVITTIFTAIYLTIGFIIALVLAIIITVFQAIWNVIGGTVLAIWNGIVSTFTAIWNFITLIFTSIWNTITGVMAAIWNTISGVFMAIYGFIVYILSTAFNFYAGIFAAIWNTTVSIFNAVWGFLRGVFSAIYNTIAGAVSAIYNTIANWFNAARNAVAGAVGGIISTVGGIAGKVIGALAGAGSWLVNAGRNIISGLINGILSMGGQLMSSITNFIKSKVPAPVLAVLGIHSPSTLFAGIGKNTMLGFIGGVASQGDAVAGAVSDVFSSLPGARVGTGMGINVNAPNVRQAGAGGSNIVTNINGDMNFKDRADIDYFLSALTRQNELAQKRMTGA